MARRILPGFPLSLGISVTYLCVLVLVPLAACFIKAASLTPSQFWRAVSGRQALSAYGVTFGCSIVASVLSVLLGLLIAWVLVRYHFPGKRMLDSLVDLPFALPTAVAGLVYSNLYAQSGWLGQYLVPLGINVFLTRLGIVVVLVFLGFPFVVRAIEPVLESLEADVEEAAASLGATRWQTFRWVILPMLMPATVTGFALSLARSIGEYGSIVFISGNLPYKTQIAPVLIVARLEASEYAEATAIAVVLLLISFTLLIVINFLERWTRRYE